MNEEKKLNTNNTFAAGTQAFSDRGHDNYSPGGKRTGDSHIKPVGTPFQGQSLNRYDELKIYHTHNYAKPIDVAAERTLGAISNEVVYTARSEQTGTANTMYTAYERARDVANISRFVADAPRQLQRTYYAASNTATAARNVGRFVTGQEFLSYKEHKPLTTRQINKELEKPFSSLEMPKMEKKFGDSAHFSSGKINRNIVFDTAKAKGLKAEINNLQGKGGALSADELTHLKDLKNQKEALDQKLRKLHGLKQAQATAHERNREVYKTKQSDINKTIRKTKKNNPKLSSDDKNIVSLLQKRKQLLSQTEKLQKLKHAGRSLRTSAVMLLSKATDDENSTFQGIMRADRVLQNRYVRSILKVSTKAVMLPFKAAQKAGVGMYRGGRFLDARFNHGRIGAKIDKSVGAAKSVKKAIKETGEKAIGSVVNSRTFKGLNGGIHTRVKRKVGSVVPNKVKTGVKGGADTLKNLNNKRKAVLNKFKALGGRIKNSKIGKAFSAVRKGVGDIFSGIGIAKKFVTKLLLYGAAGLIVCMLLGAMLTATTSIVGGFISGEWIWPDKGSHNVDIDSDKIDLTTFVHFYNDSEQKFISEINNLAADHEDKYTVVTVNYQSGALVNNFKEIMSMTAVYFEQDFNPYNMSAVKNYMNQLYTDSHYYTTTESEPYSCSGCEDRDYLCTDAYDEFATSERKNLHSKYSSRGGCIEHEHTLIFYCNKNPGSTGTDYQWELYNKYNDRGGCVGESYTRSYKCTDPLPVDATSARRKLYLKNNDGKGCKYTVSSSGIYHYYCSGHTETVTKYKCNGHKELYYTYSCDGHTETICRGEHIDLDIDVMVLGFDEIFYADSSINSFISGVDGEVCKGEEIGTFTVTYYCTEKYHHICNAGPPYKTASGTDVVPGRTIAVDKSVISLGTHVIINGHEYVAEDTGGAIKGNRIDIAVATHAEALQMGKKTYKVYSVASANTNNNDSDYSEVGVYLSDYNEYDGKYAYEYNYEFANEIVGDEIGDGEIEDDEIDDDYGHSEFEGWDEDNIEWCKLIYENMTSEFYYGLDQINKFGNGSTSYEGVTLNQWSTEVIYYNQYDVRWKLLPYSSSTIGKSGCAPTSMAMVVSSLTDHTIDPIQMCNWASSHGYYVDGVGTSWDFISAAAQNWGLPCTQASNSQAVINALKSGKMVVMSTGAGLYYSGEGHFLVLWNADDDGNIYVADPASYDKSMKTWTLEQITSGLKAWWIIG